jgi:hypothetical protein
MSPQTAAARTGALRGTSVLEMAPPSTRAGAVDRALPWALCMLALCASAPHAPAAFVLPCPRAPGHGDARERLAGKPCEHSLQPAHARSRRAPGPRPCKMLAGHGRESRRTDVKRAVELNRAIMDAAACSLLSLVEAIEQVSQRSHF